MKKYLKIMAVALVIVGFIPAINHSTRTVNEVERYTEYKYYNNKSIVELLFMKDILTPDKVVRSYY